MRKLILISVLLNLGLVAAVAILASKQKNTPAVSVGGTESQSVPEKKKRPNQKAASAKTETVVVEADGETFSWRNVESEDYKNYVANLRAIECPEETVRDIIIADVTKFYAQRLKPLRKPVEEFKFWKNENNWGGRRESEEFYQMQRDIEKEKRALLRELLGGDYEKEMAKQYGMWSRGDDAFMDKLPQDTKDKLAELASKFNDERNEIYRKAKGYHDEDVQADLRKIEKKQRDEMAKLLSPDDLFEWQLRNSGVAQNMKWNELQGFDASEEEFRAVVKAKLAAEDAMVDREKNGDRAAQDAARDAKKANEEALKNTLGEERYKEYQMAQNWEYKELVRLAERQNIPKESAMKVYEMKADVEKAARAINADKSLTPEQKREKLFTIRDMTKSEVTGLLGDRGFKSWNRNAWWLRNIIPPEPTKTTSSK